jgi:hypothetical protein
MSGQVCAVVGETYKMHATAGGDTLFLITRCWHKPASIPENTHRFQGILFFDDNLP